MKKMKLLLIMALTAIAGKVSAEEITASAVSIKAGQTASLEIGLNNTGTDYCGLQFDLVLPEGLTIAQD